MSVILKYGLAVIRDGELLLCRAYKHPTDLLMPGGKPEGDESPEEGIRREIREELGDAAVVVDGSLDYVGRFEDEAAGKPGVTVRIELYRGELEGALEPSSEIQELVWFRPGRDDDEELSGIVRRRIVPALQHAELL